MTTIEEARQVSALAENVLSDVFKVHYVAKQIQRVRGRIHEERWAEGIVAAISVIEADSKLLRAAIQIHESVFAAVNHDPVEVWEPPASSVHEAVAHEGEMYQRLGFSVLRAESPEAYPSGEYVLLSDLPSRDTMAKHANVTVKSFLTHFADEDQLSRVSVMLRQELARVCKRIERETPTATAPPRGPVKLSPREQDLLDVIREIGPDGNRTQAAIFAALAAKGKTPSEGQAKNNLAAMVRHGVLLSGYQLPEWEPG